MCTPRLMARASFIEDARRRIPSLLQALRCAHRPTLAVSLEEPPSRIVPLNLHIERVLGTHVSRIKRVKLMHFQPELSATPITRKLNDASAISTGIRRRST